MSSLRIQDHSRRNARTRHLPGPLQYSAASSGTQYEGQNSCQAFRDGLPNDSKGGNNKAAQIPIPGGCIGSLSSGRVQVPIARLGLYIVILLTLSRLDADQCSELIHFLHPCILPKPRHPRLTFIYVHKPRWRLDARINSNPDVAYAITVAGVCANKINKGFRAGRRKCLRTVNKGDSEITYVSPSFKTDGALKPVNDIAPNGRFRTRLPWSRPWSRI